MVNERKRLEAMSEIFESEKTYVNDMKLWSLEFRRFFLSCTSISSQRRFTFNNIIFLNTENIAALHEKICEEMGDVNIQCREKANIPCEDKMAQIDLTNHLDAYSELSYFDIFDKYIEQFDMYKYYIERLPKIEYVIDKEVAMNKPFANDLKRFLADTGYMIMGFKHFIFRPSQKLARYPLLFNAVLKNTADEESKIRIKNLIDVISQKTLMFDKLLGAVKNSFILFIMHYTVNFLPHVKQRHPLGLFMKKRQLITISNDVFVRSKYRNEPRPYRIYLTDNLLIVVDVVPRIFGESLNIVDDPIPLMKFEVIESFEEELGIKFFEEKQKFMLREIDGPDSIFLYFKTEAQCGELKKKIVEIRGAIHENFDTKIKLRESISVGECVLDVIMNDPFYVGGSFSEEEENRIKNYHQDIERIEENQILGDVEDTGQRNPIDELNTAVESMSMNLNSQGDEISTRVSENLEFAVIHSRENRAYRKCSEIIESVSNIDGAEDDFIILIKQDAVYIQRKNTIRLIYSKTVRKLKYIPEFKIVIFIDDETCFWSQITEGFLNKHVICSKAENFWFGKTLNTNYLVIRLISTTASSFLLLYKFENLVFEGPTQLYIGAEISNLIFFGSKIITCCQDFEVINMYTLNTHQLLNLNDMFIELFFTHQSAGKALDLFKIKKGKYLICDHKIGFVISNYGSCSVDAAFFVWYNEPKEFKRQGDYLVILSTVSIMVYNIFSSELIYYKIKHGLKFVSCCTGVWMHDGSKLYELVLPGESL